MKLVALKVIGTRIKTGILLVVFILFIFLIYYCVHDINKSITTIEIFSLNYTGKVVIGDRKVINKILEKIQASPKENKKDSREFQFKLVLHSKDENKIYFYREPSVIYDRTSGILINLNDGGRYLAPWLKKLEAMNPYGEFLTWEQAEKIFKKYDKAKIIDFETRQFFWVQRRAGSLHADAQPLTKNDSAVMKRIYSGKWSWTRRAVIVEVAGRRLAGSMNGMPHGAGAISGNDFNGHFCIHFRDSKLHSRRDDLAHKIMIWKAGGVIDKMLANAPPQTVMEVTLKYLEQGDLQTASRLMGIPKESTLYNQLGTIEWLVVSKYDTSKEQENLFKVYFSYKLNKGRTVNNFPVNLQLIKGQGQIPWKIKSESIAPLLIEEMVKDT